MAKLTKRTIIAKELINIYMSMEEDKMTETQKIIKEEIEFREANTGEGHNPRLEYFTKRIDNINNAFLKNKNIIAKKPDLIMPEPTFDIFAYDDNELIKFLMAYIEKMESERKTKYNYNDKISIDEDYSVAIEIINSVSNVKYENLEYVDTIHYYTNLTLLERSMNLKNVIQDNNVFKYNNTFNKNSILRKLLKKYHSSYYANLPERLVFATMFNYNLMELINSQNIFFNCHCEDPMKDIANYRVLWTLFIRVIIKNFQYLSTDGTITEKNFNDIIEKLNILVVEIKNERIEEKNEKNLYNGFYRYNYFLKARAIIDAELKALHIIHEDEYIFIKKEDLFFDETNTLKKEYSNMEDILLEKLNELFNSGTKPTKNETFNKNIKYCKEFIPIYNHLAGRTLDQDKINIVRAIYRALFVNKITYNRQNSFTISKKVVQLENPDTTSDVNVTFKDKKSDIRKSNKTIFEDNYILGTSISNEIMLEYPNGYNILCQKYKFMLVFSELSLLIFYKYCPHMDAYPKELINAYRKIKYYFEQIMTILYFTS